VSLMKKMTKAIQQDARMKRKADEEINKYTDVYELFGFSPHDEDTIHLFFKSEEDATSFAQQQNINVLKIETMPLFKYMESVGFENMSPKDFYEGWFSDDDYLELEELEEDTRDYEGEYLKEIEEEEKNRKNEENVLEERRLEDWMRDVHPKIFPKK
jgi:hypothetical protein